jgi:hypothetical protein
MRDVLPIARYESEFLAKREMEATQTRQKGEFHCLKTPFENGVI